LTFLAKIFGTKSDREIKKILPIVNQVNQFYDTLKDKDISYLQSRTKELQVIIKKSIEEQESKKTCKY
jgi:preprotein translocase subunit SecA